MKRYRSKKEEWRKIKKMRRIEADKIISKLRGKEDYITTGYKGLTSMDINSYYAPYIPLLMK